MPFIPTANAVKSVLGFTLANQQVKTILTFSYAGPPSTANMISLNTALHTFWTNQLKPQMAPQLSLQEIVTYDLASSSAPSATLVITGGEVGTSGTDCLHNNVALCVTKRTASRGRNYRGRAYLSGIPSTQGSGSTGISSAWVANVLTAFSWLLTPANVASFTWTVLSYFLNKTPRSTGLSTPVTAISADFLSDSMRRRLAGRGA